MIPIARLFKISLMNRLISGDMRGLWRGILVTILYSITFSFSFLLEFKKPPPLVVVVYLFNFDPKT